TQSGLYRIKYVGTESTAPAEKIEDAQAAQARGLRHQLESFHGRRDPSAISFAWPHLNSTDRFIRYAARVAIESQDVRLWQDKALAEKQPTASINALVALCRAGNKLLGPAVLKSLNNLRLEQLSEEQTLEALRAYGL